MSSSLLLRPWLARDAPTLLRVYRGTADLARQLPALETLADARAYIAWSTEPGRRIFALTENGVPVGQFGLTSMDNTHRTAWFFYWLDNSSRRKGYAARAAATVADWALDSGEARRLELGHRTDNPSSGRVALAAGFIEEGIERAKFDYDGVLHDVRTMGRLATDPRPPAYEPIKLLLAAS